VTRYALHPQVGLREEKFGALAYHYGNRRLTFLNDDRLVAVIRTVEQYDDIDAALAAVGVVAEQRPAFYRALERLREAEVLICE
jgi:putative mycofactocin binding protein MftB